jgi:hypothetical protein
MAISDDTRARDPNCLHCLINALVDRWIEEGRVSPTETVQRIAEVLGGYIGLFAAADRKRAMAEAIKIIGETCTISVVHHHGH